MANQTPQKNVDDFQLPKGGLIKKLLYIMAFVGPASMICSTSMGPGTATILYSGRLLVWIMTCCGWLF